MADPGRFSPRRAIRARGLSAGRMALALGLLAASLLSATTVHPQIARAAPKDHAVSGHRAAPSDRAAINDVGQRPYMGWSSWSLESTNYPGVNTNGPASWLTEQHVLQEADVMAAKLKQYGYTYVNIDAGWQSGFDAYGRPLASKATFPDGIGYVANYVHKKGLKLGIYLAVGLDPRAWGSGSTPIYGAPGCYTRDIVYPDLRTTNGWNSAYKINYASPCAQAYINSIADEFASWGVDFLKLDGVGPGSFQGDANHDNTADVEAWSRALKQTGRPIQFVISWALSHNEASTWQQYTNGWRIDTDVECYCNTLVTWNNSVKERWDDVVQWIPDAGPGHWNNLDSLDVGNGAMDGLTDAERQSYMTLWAIEAAPLYSGDDLTKLDSYGLSLLTNKEVIAVDQAGNPAKPISQRSPQQVWYARNRDGSYTVALFNLGSAPATVTAHWNGLGIVGPAAVRDLWSHANLGDFTGSFSATLPVHGSRLLRITPRDIPANNPSMPANLHGTDATASTISLAWDPSWDHGTGVTGYDVYIDGKKATSASQPSVTLSGLAPATTYRFTVAAYGPAGRESAQSKTLMLTTPAAGGPATYEAESPANTIGGGAVIAPCSACSGGEKVGYLGGSGYLIFNGVTAPRAGTYLMRLSYVDGDSSRTAVVTVGGQPFDLPLPGTNDNNWDAVQTATVPVHLHAGDNTIEFGNPNGYVFDVDKITL
ncbi:MAG TPA: fibronectin type III domain-containing protein [Streptosporangiaceae bacterium]|nr:fibronectin type III domain-containing protein [Streptosporangiaceae bacterium]